MRKHYPATLVMLMIGLLVSGCALTQYGRLQVVEKTDPVTVDTLANNWEAYEIYYTGQHAGHPSAVLFERKDDERGFTSTRWVKVKDKELLDGLISNIRSQPPMGPHYPRLWRVVGADGHLYGYMFTAWNHAVLKPVDEKTLFVHDLPLPPYLHFSGKADSGRSN